MQHVLSARQFNREQLAEIFVNTDMMRLASANRQRRRELASWFVGGIVATLFYEPSTRTRLSFESAAQRLGMGVISTENAAEFSSAAKGETIEDTIRVVGSYADLIVMRHTETGAAERAARVSNKPIINAGDGKGEHPTQALLDAYTIQDIKGRLDNLRVVIGGDLKRGRTARSLAQLLALYPNNHISFVSTPELRMGNDVLSYLHTNRTGFDQTADMLSVLPQADVVYWTRLQKERESEDAPAELDPAFTLTPAALGVMAPGAIILHPLPRVGEIDPVIDVDPRARYFEQAENGLYLRMALIRQLVGEG